MITKEQVLEVQEKWGNGVVKIGSLKENRSECEAFASSFLDARYAFGEATVLFKPTKCEIEQFERQNPKHCLILLQEMTGLVMKIKVLLFNLGQRLGLKFRIYSGKESNSDG